MESSYLLSTYFSKNTSVSTSNKFLKCLPFALMHGRKAIKTRINLIFIVDQLNWIYSVWMIGDHRVFQSYLKIINFFPSHKKFIPEVFLSSKWLKTDKVIGLAKRTFHFFSTFLLTRTSLTQQKTSYFHLSFETFWL